MTTYSNVRVCRLPRWASCVLLINEYNGSVVEVNHVIDIIHLTNRNTYLAAVSFKTNSAVELYYLTTSTFIDVYIKNSKDYGATNIALLSDPSYTYPGFSLDLIDASSIDFTTLTKAVINGSV